MVDEKEVFEQIPNYYTEILEENGFVFEKSCLQQSLDKMEGRFWFKLNNRLSVIIKQGYEDWNCRIYGWKWTGIYTKYLDGEDVPKGHQQSYTTTMSGEESFRKYLKRAVKKYGGE